MHAPFSTKRLQHSFCAFTGLLSFFCSSIFNSFHRPELSHTCNFSDKRSPSSISCSAASHCRAYISRSTSHLRTSDICKYCRISEGMSVSRPHFFKSSPLRSSRRSFCQSPAFARTSMIESSIPSIPSLFRQRTLHHRNRDVNSNLSHARFGATAN